MLLFRVFSAAANHPLRHWDCGLLFRESRDVSPRIETSAAGGPLHSVGTLPFREPKPYFPQFATETGFLS